MKQVVIIGAGLAGSCVAAQLVQAGLQVTLIDGRLPGAASPVAAGLINPVAGQRMALNWRAAEMLAALHAFFDTPLLAPLRVHLHALPIYRPFASAQQANDWAGSATALTHVVQLQTTPHQPATLHNPHGGIWVRGGGWLDVPTFLPALHAQLAHTGRCRIIHAMVDTSHISPNKHSIALGHDTLHYDALLWASGHHLPPAPFAQPLHSLRPLTGQLLHLQLRPDPGLTYILAGQGYLLPRGAGHYVLGSTHEKHASGQPTTSGQAELLAKLQHWLGAGTTATILAHQAGVRPTSPDRRPILGRHPQHPTVYYLNGLGTRGILQAPLLAQWLAQGLLAGTTPWPAETDLGRKALATAG